MRQMHHPILKTALTSLKHFSRLYQGTATAPSDYVSVSRKELTPPSACTASGLLYISKLAKTCNCVQILWSISEHCLVIIFFLFFLFLKAIFKTLTVFLVFIPFYCCVPLWVVFWHRFSLVNFQLQWFNLI